MEVSGIMSEMHRSRLVAVVRSRTSEEALAVARGVTEGGVRFVEITLTVPDAIRVIETLAKQKDVFVGAGTVLSKENARKAIAAGAQFIVSPTLELDLIPICKMAGVLCITGAASPTEVLTAMRAGTDLVKIFPADCLGGPNFLRQMLGPFPDASFMVSGGVNKDNVKDYVKIGVTGIVLGSSFLSNELVHRGHDCLVREVRDFVGQVSDACGE
jgi:2-dehydro-3-deoxyphosphogluconate aldolase/(4S)-4-hydroxy-2-oxoglutarate aldolase